MAVDRVEDWIQKRVSDYGKKRQLRDRKSFGARLAEVSNVSLLDVEATRHLWAELVRIFQKRGWWDAKKSFLWEMVPAEARLTLALEATVRLRAVLLERVTTISGTTTDGEGLLLRATYPRLPDAWIIDPTGMLHCYPHDPYEQPFTILVRYSQEALEVLHSREA